MIGENNDKEAKKMKVILYKEARYNGLFHSTSWALWPTGTERVLLWVDEELKNPLMMDVYLYLVFTKSVDSNFRVFWLAPVTRNILGYSLFCEPREKWRVVSRKF